MENYMMRVEFEELFDQIVKWFRMKMTRENADISYDKIKFYPVEGLEYAINFLIENGKPTPGNFPTVNDIINLIMKWLDTHPDEKFKRMEFDKYNDYSYPLSKLWDGYKVLIADGQTAFERFAERNRMPAQDRERVVMKYKVSQAHREMPNLIQNVGKTV